MTKDKKMFKCQNCGFIAEHDDLELLDEERMFDRFDVGDMFTNVQCTKCGALCFPALSTGTCPFCNNISIEGSQVEIDDDKATQECSCWNCHRTWKDEYCLVFRTETK